jgi:hypothetical protein
MWQGKRVDDIRKETPLFYHYLVAVVYGFIREVVDSHVSFY